MNLFNLDNPIINGLSRVCDIMLLNILWLICSLPIVTIGASTTALYYCMLKINRDSDSGILAMFFKSFRQNLKQGCILTIVFFLSGLFLYVDYQACAIIDGILGIVIRVVIDILLIVWGIMISYAFPMLAQFDNSIKNILKNSLLLGIMHINKTIPVFLVNAIPVMLFWMLPEVFILLIPLFVVFGVSLMALINSRILLKVFEQYLHRT